MTERTDEEYQAWLKDLVEKYNADIYQHVRSLCHMKNPALLDHAEDYVQDAFMLLWAKRKRLYGYQFTPGWIYRTATNVFRNAHAMHIRRSKPYVSSPQFQEQQEENDPEAIVILKQQKELILDVLGQEKYDFLLLYLVGRHSTAVVVMPPT